MHPSKKISATIRQRLLEDYVHLVKINRHRQHSVREYLNVALCQRREFDYFYFYSNEQFVIASTSTKMYDSLKAI